VRRLLLALSLLLLAAPAAAPAAAGSPSGERPGWTPVDCGCSHALSIDAVSKDLVFLGTDSGISRSTDGGFTWHNMDTPIHNEVDRVSFADESTGVAEGQFEGVLVTRDGGSTWKQYRPWSGPTSDVTAVPGKLFGLSPAALYASTDGGIVWKQQKGALPRGSTPRMDWRSATDGVVVSAPNVATTTDGGATFVTATRHTLSLFDTLSLPGGSAFAIGQDARHSGHPWVDHVTGTTAAAADLPGRGVADEQERGISTSGGAVYVVGTEGLIARSPDGGTTWAYETTPPSYERVSFFDVDSIDADHAWIAVYAGRILIRNAPRIHDVTTTPHRGLGLGLLGLGGLAIVGAAAAVGTGRRPIAGGLAAVAVIVCGGGLLAVTDHAICPAGGCTTLRSLPDPTPTRSTTVTPTPSPTASPTASPTPSPTASATASPTTSTTPSPSASASPTPSGTARPSSSATASPTPSRTPSPTPSPTASGSFTAQLTTAPTCDANGGSHAGVITLRNATGKAVSWSATAREKSGKNPWARLSPSKGSVKPGKQATFSVTPAAGLCQPGGDATTDHVDVTHGTATTAVSVTVTPQT
jgi:photosystem II stability/assembly factor-like uncharacterized protein